MQFSKRMEHFGENIFTILLNMKTEIEKEGKRLLI